MFGLTSKKGFTLIELLIAVTIIGILSAVLVPRIANVLPTARDSARQASLNELVTALENFNVDEGFYPNANSTNFCFNAADPTTTIVDSRPDPDIFLTDFLTDYLRGGINTHKVVADTNGAANCDIGGNQSAKYTPADGGYILGIAVENAEKAGNSTSISALDPADAEGETNSYYVIKR